MEAFFISLMILASSIWGIELALYARNYGIYVKTSFNLYNKNAVDAFRRNRTAYRWLSAVLFLIGVVGTIITN